MILDVVLKIGKHRAMLENQARKVLHSQSRSAWWSAPKDLRASVSKPGMQEMSIITEYHLHAQ
jgi:hypothetical protein